MKNLKQKNILFLEDNMSFAQDTIKFLLYYVKEVIHVTSIEDAHLKFDENNIDIIISDLKVDDGIALSFIEKIRQTSTTVPIVVLSAHKDEDLLFRAIPLGLTTYAIKPINLKEFEVVLKKCSELLVLLDENKVFVKNETFYDKGKKLLFVDNKSITLTKKEAGFFELLIENKKGIVTKEMIQTILWENDPMSEAALKNFLLRIRKKTYRDLFYTIQGVGYRLE